MLQAMLAAMFVPIVMLLVSLIRAAIQGRRQERQVATPSAVFTSASTRQPVLRPRRP